MSALRTLRRRMRRQTSPRQQQTAPAIELLEPRLLLSADLGTLSLAEPLLVDLSPELHDVSLRVAETDGDQTVQVVDGVGVVQAERALEQISEIIVEGTPATDDTLRIDYGTGDISVPVTFNGGEGGLDTLRGPLADSTWQITGPDSGQVEGIQFNDVENLTGAPDNEDTFVFQDGGSLTGMVEGGEGGFDTLVTQGGANASIVVEYTGPDSGTILLDGNVIAYAGLEPVLIDVAAGADITYNLPSASDNLELRLVSGNSFIVDSLNGTFEDTTFTDPGSSATITINLGDGNDTISLTDLETLDAALEIYGGTSGTDTGTADKVKATQDANITLADASLTVGSKSMTLGGFELGELTGGDSINTLDASAFTGDVTLRGEGNNDILKGGAGDDTLIGGAGNDKFVFADGWGTDTVDAGAGTDTLDFTGFTGTLSLSGTTFTGDGNQVSQTDPAEMIDVTLSVAEQTAFITDGLNALVDRIVGTETIDALGSYGLLGNLLPLISFITGDSGPNGASLGSILGIGDIFEYLQTHLNGATTTTLSDLVAAFESFTGQSISNNDFDPDTFDMGDITGLGASGIEARYEADPGGAVVIYLAFDLGGSQSTSFDLNLGTEAEALGVVVDTDIDLEISFDFEMELGLEIGSTPEFFVETAELGVDVSAEIPDLDASVSVGFLEAEIVDGSISMEGGLSIALNDPTPGDSRITISDLAESLTPSLVTFTPDVPATPFDASLPLTINAAGLDSGMLGDLAGAAIELSYPTVPEGIFSGEFPVIDQILSTAGVDLLDFSNITPTDIIGMLGQIMSALSGLGESDLLDVSIPFTDITVGKLLDYGTSFKREVLDPLFASGDAFKPDNTGDGIPDFTFGSVQDLALQLASALGITVEAAFDQLDQELTYTFNWSSALSLGGATIATTQEGGGGNDEEQTVTIPDSALSFRLGYEDEEGNINFTGELTHDPNMDDDDAAAMLDAALEVLPGLNTHPDNVSVARAGNVYTVTFQENLANTDVPEFVSGLPLAFGESLGEFAGVEASAVIEALASITANMTFGIDLSGNSVIEITPAVYQPKTGEIDVLTVVDGGLDLGGGDYSDEQVTVTVNALEGETFRLAYRYITATPGSENFVLTAPIAVGAPATGAGSVQNALAALSGIAVADIDVDKTGNVYTITFQNGLADKDVELASDDGILSSAATFNLTVTNDGASTPFIDDLPITIAPDDSIASLEELAENVEAAIEAALHAAGLTLGFSKIELTSSSASKTAPHDSLLESQNDIGFKLVFNDGAGDGDPNDEVVSNGKLMQRQLMVGNGNPDGGAGTIGHVAEKLQAAIAEALERINDSRTAPADIVITVGNSGGHLTFNATGLQSGESISIKLAPIITASAGGGRISLFAPSVSVIPETGDYYTASQVVDRTLRVDITNAYSNTAFTELGLASTPTQFNGQLNNDVTFTLVINGDEYPVTLLQSATTGNGSIDDLVDQLQGAVEDALPVDLDSMIEVYRLHPDGNRIGIRSKPDGGGTDVESMSMIVSGDETTNGAISDLGFESTEGTTPLTERAVATEFFLQDVSLTGVATLNIPDARLAASIGFLGIEATGSGLITANAGLALKNPLVSPGDPLENRVDFDVLFNALSDSKYFYNSTETGGTVEDPATGVLDASLGGEIGFHLDIAPTGVISGIDGATATADLSLVISDWLESAPTAEDLEFNFAGPDWDEIFSRFQEFSFDDIIGALQQLLQMLRSLEGSGGGAIANVLNYKWPLVDRSLSEIVDFAADWADRIEALISDPSGSLQELAVALADIFDIPYDIGPNGELFEAGTTTLLDILEFIPYDDSTPELAATTGVLDFNFDLGIGAELNRPFSLDLADAGLPSWLNNLVGVSASGNLDVSADVNLALRMGLDLFGDDKAFFLYTGDEGTKLTASASAAGYDLDFTAQIGPFAIFVIGGSAELSAELEVGLANYDGSLSPYAGPENKGRFKLIGLEDGDLTTDLDDIGSYLEVQDFQKDGGSDTDSVFISGEGEVSLPLFIGTVDNPVPLDFLGSDPGNNNTLHAEIDFVEALDDDSDNGIEVTLPSDLFSALENLELPSLFTLLADPSIVVDGLDRVLLSLQEAVSGQILGIDLPLISDYLKDNPVANFIGGFRGDFLTPLAKTIRENNLNIEGLVDLVSGTIEDVFSGLGLLESPLALELYDAGGSLITGSGPGGIYNLANYLVAQSMEFKFDIGQTLTFATDDISFDLGVPLLGLEADIQPRVTLDWGLEFGFGLDVEDGFYFVTGDDDLGTIADDELSLSLVVDFGSTSVELSGNIEAADLAEVLADMNGISSADVTRTGTEGDPNWVYNVTNVVTDDFDLNDMFVLTGAGVTISGVTSNSFTLTVPQGTDFRLAGKPAGANGRLLFLALKVLDGVSTDEDDVPDEFTQLYIHGGLDIVDPSDTPDGRLTFAEISRSSFGEIVKPSIEGGADLRLDAEVDFSTISENLSEVLPSITTDIYLDWDIGYNPGLPVEFDAPSVMLADISLDMGSFISDFAGPILDGVKEILEPFEFLIGPDGFFNMRIPLLSDLMGTTITGKDLIAIFAPEYSPYVVGFLDFVEQLYFLIDLVEDATAEGNVIINLGDMIITDTAHNYQMEDPENPGEYIPTPEFAGILGDLGSIFDLGLSDPTEPGVNLDDVRQAFEGAEETINGLTQSSSGTEGTAGSTFSSSLDEDDDHDYFRFPILDASNIFKLLMGQNVSLVEIDLPELAFEFFYRQEVPVWGPIVATFGGGVGGGIDIDFGYDTKGLYQFMDTWNPAYLLNGFYLCDLDENGSDVREGWLNAMIAVGAGISIGPVKAGAEGGIEFTVDFNLSDLDGDGKVRIDEMAGNIVANGYNPLAIFDVSGLVEFFLRVYAEIDLVLFTLEFEYEFLRLELFSFEIPFERPAILATQNGGDLTINIGPNASGRLQGNTDDIAETVYVKSSGDAVVVWSDQFNVNETVASISPFTDVKKIIVNGGAADDYINLEGLSGSIEVEVHGGEGNDTIIGGPGEDTLYGDGGADEIWGRGGADVIDGGPGDDIELHGEGGSDTIMGGGGNDVLYGEGEDDTLIGGLGDDQLVGGAGNNTYDLADFGSLETIDAGDNDTLSFMDKPQNLTFFITETSITAGFSQIEGTTGLQLADYENQTIVNNAVNVVEIIGSDYNDTFHVWGTPAALTLDGQKGNDRYIFYTGSTTINATVDDRTIFDDDDGSPSNPWNEDVIEIVDQGDVADVTLPSEGYIADDITITSSMITMGGSQTVYYEAPSETPVSDPEDERNVLRIKVKSGGENDNVTVASTASTVPVRIEGGSDDDIVTVGDPSHGVDNILGFMRPGLNTPFGLGPVVLVGGGDHDTVIIDDSADSSDNVGNMTAFLEKRLGFEEWVEVGVVTGLDMQLKMDVTDNDIYDPEVIDNRVEFEGFEVVDVRLGTGDDDFVIGGEFDLGKVSPTGGQASDLMLVTTEFPKSRLVALLDTEAPELGPDPDGDGIKEIVYTISGMTVVNGGPGVDDIRVLETQVLEQVASPVITIAETAAGVRGVSGEEVHLEIGSEVGYFVLEFADQSLDDTDPSGDDTVPGAEQTVVLPYTVTDTELEDALEALRLVGGATYRPSVTGSNGVFDITFHEANGDLPDLLAYDTRLLVAGGDGDDEISIQSIDQPTYVQGGNVLNDPLVTDDNDTLYVNVKITSGGVEPASTPEGYDGIPPAKAEENGVNAPLTIDGGEDGDKYYAYLFGGEANSQINLFDSGLSTDDSSIVFGTEASDMFLMRAAVALDGLAFVAMIKPAVRPLELEGDDRPLPPEQTLFDVERINYRDTLDSMQIFALEGDDVFGIDDTRLNMEIYGGEGEEFFQIGQLYKSRRNAVAGVPYADAFTTLETTRGYLSNGISKAMKIYGGEDNDEFVVYHNLAPLVLYGDAGDDSFLIRAFALVGSQEDLRERTDVSGGAGADLIRYAVNAPVNIDGGDGFDTVIVIGTEFNDDFVVTENGIYGAGLNIQFVRVETVELDGDAGDDRFFILGTHAGILTKITGGLGSDTFFANGPTPDVVSNDLLGHSGLISHSVDSDDPEFSGIKVEGISANVGDDDEPFVRITVTDGTSVVSQVDEGELDAYTVVLTRKPENGAKVIVTSYAPTGVKFDDSSIVPGVDMGDDNDSIALTFTGSNWYIPKVVYFRAYQTGGTAITRTAKGGTIASGGDGQNARQTLVVSGTEGSFKLKSTDSDIGGTWTTDAITFDIRGDGKLDGYDFDALDKDAELDNLKDAIAAAINAKLGSLSGPSGAITAEVTRARSTFFIEFLNTADVTYTIDELEVVEEAITFNDIVGTASAFITHDVTLSDESGAGDDAIRNLYVQGTVAAQREGRVTVQYDSGDSAKQILNFNATDGNFKITMYAGSSDEVGQTSEEMLFYPLESDKVMATIDVALKALAGSAYEGITQLADFVYEVEFDSVVELLEVDDSNLTWGERTLRVLGGLPEFILDPDGDGNWLENPDENPGETPYEVNMLRGATVKVTQGAGIGQTRLIIANDANTITVANPWIEALDDTSRIEILRYEGVVLPATMVDIVGDDANAIDLRETGGETVVFEAPEVHGFSGSGDTAVELVDAVSVSLTADPDPGNLEDVTLTIDSLDAYGNQQLFYAIYDGAAYQAVDSLEFSSDELEANAWNKAQTLYVFGYDDTLTEGFHKSVLSLTADSGYTHGSELLEVSNSVVVDIADNEVALAMVLESDNSTDVVETGNFFNDGSVPADDVFLNNAADDTYQIVLSKAPTENVTVNLFADPTRTQRGAGLLGIRAYDPEVVLDAGSLLFTTSNWSDAQLVTVTAADDDKVDGMDSKSFPTMFDQVNKIEGPLVITGGISEDRSADLEREPIYLPYESNYKKSIGTVQEVPEGYDESYTLTIDLDEIIEGETIVDTRRQGGSAGVVTVATNVNGDPGESVQEIQLLTVDAVSGQFTLTLNGTDFSDPITYDPKNPAATATAIQTEFNDIDGGSGPQIKVEEAGSVFIITFQDTKDHELIQVADVPAPNELTRTGVEVTGSVDEQILTVYGNAGILKLELSGVGTTGEIAFSPDNPLVVQADVIESALKLLDPAIEVSGSGSTYVITGAAAAILEAPGTSLRVDEVQTLTINASSGEFALTLDDTSANTTTSLGSEVSAEDLQKALLALDAIDSVTVVKDENDPFYTIIMEGAPGHENLAQLEVVDAALEEDRLKRTVKEALETQLDTVIESPEDLKTYTLEITRGDAKNKFRIVIGGSDPDDPASPADALTTVEISRPWEAGLKDEIPSLDPGESEFTMEKTNPNLLVDENEETDFFFMNDTDNVTDTDELPTANLYVTPDRLTGLGMAEDQLVGGRPTEGGIRYTGLEELIINLGPGDNLIEIFDTQPGATTIHSGDGQDEFNVRNVSGHTFLHGGAGADIVNVGDESLLSGINALLTVTGDVPQAVALTLGKGSPYDPVAMVNGVDEIQQVTVDATGGTFKLGFIVDGVRYFTEAMAHNIEDNSGNGTPSMEDALQAVIDAAFSDRATGDDVSVTRGGNVYRIEFINGMGEQDVPLLEVNDTADADDLLHVGLTMEKPAEFYDGDVLNIDNSADDADSQAVLTQTSLTGLGMGDLGTEGTSFNEIQTLRLDATGGTFELGIEGAAPAITSGDLDFDITAEELDDVLETMYFAYLNQQRVLAGKDEFAAGDVSAGLVEVAQNDDVYVIRFVGLLSNADVAQLTVDGSGLTRNDELPGGDVVTPQGLAETATRVDGITSGAQNEIQEFTITADGGTFTLAFPDTDTENVTEALPFNATRADVQLALEALPAIVPGDVFIIRTETDPNTVEFTIEFIGELSSTDVAEIIVDGSALTLTTGDASASVETLYPGLDTGLNDVQVLTVNATAGTYRLEMYLPAVDKTLMTAALPFDADSEQVRRALQHELARELNGLNDGADLYRTREAFKSDFSVMRTGNTYIIGFQGVTRQLDGGEGVSLIKVIGDDDFDASGGAEILTRMDGINYYGFEQVNIDFGSGDDVLNVQGTSTGSYRLDVETDHAATNISLADGDDRIFISSNADLDVNTDKTTAGQPDVFEFLTGDLDAISGNLNLDAGEGRHRLLVSDEAATEGDDSIRISDVIETPTGGGEFDDTAATEIQIQGMAFGDITYGADPEADFFDGIIYWTGSGGDTINIDGTHVRPGERTTTILNTGLGDDHVTVDLADEGEDGFFVLHTMGGAETESPVDPTLADGVDDPSDNDTVRAAESTLPLIILGGLGDDDIIAGKNEDVVFGDFGRVQYLDGEGELVAVFGFGGRGDMISSQIIDPTWVISRDLNLGGVDILEGQEDDDILIGGPGGNSIGDYIDGDTGDDLIFGDAVRLFRRDTVVGSLGDITNPRFRTLSDDHIYTRSDTDGVGGDVSGAVLVDSIWRDYRNNPLTDPVAAWTEYEIIELYHTFDMENYEIQTGVVTDLSNSFGEDYIAGGAGHDVIFGQLGNDVIQGDGAIESAVGSEGITLNRIPAAQAGLDPYGAQRVANGTIDLTPTLNAARKTLDVNPSFEAASDGDDYIEGNGGDDVIFGNLGQDDIIGDNSSLFTLDDYEERLPAGSDIIFGGAGTDIGRNDIGDATIDADGVITVDPTGHARDADVIAGDNANMYRLVGTGSVDGGGFLEFNYDQDGDFEDRGDLRIIPRAVELLDYTLGGSDFDPASAADDIGAADEIHGESGDDFIYGMVANDVLFGDGQDDDLIGGWGADWISGGTGQDGVLGDDGRIFTSRNSNVGEPLYGVDGFANNEMDLYIDTPGKMQQEVINVEGELKKTVDLTPFNLTETGQPDDVYDEPEYADDIIYGGMGSDFLHGGGGDDAISGAEALPEYFAAPINPGDVLRFGDHSRAGEFFDYNEYEALVKMDPFLLNFDETEGVYREGGTIPKVTGNQDPNYGPVYDDGADKIFGDLGNDWLVGGTGRDNMYGGFGNDLLNADDDLTTNGGLNDQPDTHPTYEDRAYGGAGRDVLIANTGGDRLIDWIGEFNSFLVPFAPFGMATVSRTLQPQLPEYLYSLSESDGADPTRIEDGGDPARNGEPWGELGLVLQKDPNWHDQTGAPIDPQAGNIPGGKRDVLRSADFNDGESITTYADSGVFEVKNGVLGVTAESIGGDAVALFDLDDYLPSYFEVTATITMQKPTGGWKANSYIIFDYQNKYDFKFAGIDASRDKIQLGHRTTDGWIIDAETPAKIKPGVYYNVLVAVNGTNVTVRVDGTEYFSHTYEARVDAGGWVYGLNDGMVGLGSDNSRGTYDNIAVQVLPPEYTFQATEDFEDAELTVLTVPQSGDWQMADGRYDGTPVMGDRAVSLLDIGLSSGLAANSILEVDVTVNTDATTGVVFDYYGPGDFKYAGLSAESDALIIGHFVNGQWLVDASFDSNIKSGIDYEMALSLKGAAVSVSLRPEGAKNWQAMVGHVFNAVTVDGDFGLLAKEGSASFDTVTIRTDDSAFRTEGDALTAASLPDAVDAGTILSADQLDFVVGAAIDRLAEGFSLDATMLAVLNDGINFEVADLSGLTIGWTEGGTVLIDDDAAGYGWFVDETPADDVEFGLPGDNGELLADSFSDAFGQMDLLTVVMHELGHVLGYDDLTSEADAGDMMYEMLTSGTRRTETRLAVASETILDTTTAWPGLSISRNGHPQFSDWHSEWLQRHTLLP